MVIYLHAPYDVLEKRLLKRGQTSGRSDDNMKIIQKRFLTFRKETLPVVALYTSVLKRVKIKPRTQLISIELKSIFKLSHPSSLCYYDLLFSRNIFNFLSCIYMTSFFSVQRKIEVY
jgi:hypothetical protein